MFYTNRCLSTAQSEAPKFIYKLHPAIVYKNQMKLKRKAYFEENKFEALKSKSLVRQKRSLKSQLNQLQKLDIEMFKHYRNDAFNASDAAISSQKPTKIDHLLASAPKKANPAKDISDKLEVKETRKQNFINTRKQKSDKNLDALVQLYHLSSQFVTYSNLDQKVEAVFMKGPSRKVQIEALLAEHERNMDSENLGKMGKAFTNRELALRQTIQGYSVNHNTELDVNGIREKLAVIENGDKKSPTEKFTELMQKKFDQ
ncbi:hypothetical protein BC833DRAFT_146645 [Globomyces pollinis-pini]|nr:hypothetical protein BC833DRAFT_146645 [Globomyces pollinis-pini]